MVVELRCREPLILILPFSLLPTGKRDPFFVLKQTTKLHITINTFQNTLQDHIREFLKSNPNHPTEEPMKMKTSGGGAKMSTTINFMILSFSLLQTGKRDTFLI